MFKPINTDLKQVNTGRGRIETIIMKICKAPTLWLKALNKHSITHIMYIEMEMLSEKKNYIRKRRKKKKS